MLFYIPFFLLIALLGCNSKMPINPNPYITRLPNVSFQANLNLPQYTNLNFSGSVFLFENQGINGVVVANLNDVFYAWEATCSNHAIEKCSKLSVENSIGTCTCSDGYKYSFLNGHLLNSTEGRETVYPLVAYKTVFDRNFNSLRIVN